MTNILLIGADGQVGTELKASLSQLGEVYPFTRSTLDLTQDEQISATIQEINPQLIVNAAAYTAVDKAESEPELAHQINAIAPKIIATEAQKNNAFFLHISTDYVFDGQKNTPYLETDKTNPLSVYGKSKLAGESAIQTVTDNYCILRTAWVYGVAGKGNFVKTMLCLGKERPKLNVVMDQVGSPTWSYDIAITITQLLSKQAKGIYHFTNSGVISWYDFAMAIFEEAKALNIPLTIEQVLPITTAEYPTPAKRPAYSVLSSKKVSDVLGNPPPYWRASLRKMLQQMQMEKII
ncbi:MAG: dTDP-4-dehydrorhamnose reductase [Microcystaceae cyanobacterium]